jgi:hypothetical protein
VEGKFDSFIRTSAGRVWMVGEKHFTQEIFHASKYQIKSICKIFLWMSATLRDESNKDNLGFATIILQ